jgi:hypothetical protein
MEWEISHHYFLSDSQLLLLSIVVVVVFGRWLAALYNAVVAMSVVDQWFCCGSDELVCC